MIYFANKNKKICDLSLNRRGISPSKLTVKLAVSFNRSYTIIIELLFILSKE